MPLQKLHPSAVYEVPLLGSAALLVEGALGVGEGVGRLARRADPPNEALADDPDDRRGHQEGLDPHVEEAVEGGDGVGGVQRREDEVAGQGGLHRDASGLDVSDLPDEDDVGVLAQDGAKASGEGEARPARSSGSG